MVDAGERLGPFLLLERIGRGGMGEVWLAQPLGLPGAGDLCVVKTVRAEVVDDADALKRFADESRLAMLLNGAHIARTVDAGRAGDVRYLALELVEGLDLLNLMNRLPALGRNLDDAVALWIAACVLEGLASAHGAHHPLTGAAMGVVHRDISPHNVMCTKAGDAVVIDFGLALSSVKQSKTEQDVVFGKLTYMAPEQARGARVDARSDIFAAGVVLYELLSGQRYWGSLGTSDIWARVGREDWVPPHWHTLAPDLQAFLAPMIARNVDQRSTDASERLTALMPLLVGRGGATAAALQLATIVQEVAEPELSRVARARAAMVQVPSVAPVGQFDAPPTTAPFELPPDTVSFAVEEAALVAAVLATRTRLPPAFTTLTSLPAHATVADLPAWAQTQTAMPVAPLELRSPFPTPAQALAATPASAVTRASPPAPTLVVPRAQQASSSPTAQLPSTKTPAASRTVALAAGVVVVALAVVAAVLLLPGSDPGGPVDSRSAAGAGEPPTPLIGAVTPIAPVVPDAGVGDVAAGDVAGANADAGTPAWHPTPMPTPTPTPTPVKKTLEQRLQALSRCSKPCVAPLLKPPPATLSPAMRERLVSNCEATCRGRR